jgi:hypothetical protein
MVIGTAEVTLIIFVDIDARARKPPSIASTLSSAQTNTMTTTTELPPSTKSLPSSAMVISMSSNSTILVQNRDTKRGR